MFGELVVQSGLCGTEEVQECLEVQEKMAAQGKEMGLADIMIRKRYITAFQARALLGEQRFTEIRTEDLLYGRIAVANRLIGETQLAAAIERQAQARRVGGEVPRLGDILARDCGLTGADQQRIHAAQQRLARSRIRCACGWVCGAGRQKPAECPECGLPFPPNLRELLRTRTAGERRSAQRLERAAIFGSAAVLLLLALWVAHRGRPPQPGAPLPGIGPPVAPAETLAQKPPEPIAPPPGYPRSGWGGRVPAKRAADLARTEDPGEKPVQADDPWADDAPPPPAPPPPPDDHDAAQEFWNDLQELVDADRAGEAAHRIARDQVLDDPTKMRSLRNLTLYVLNRERYAETAQVLETYEMLTKGDPWSRGLRGQLALCEGNFEDALAIFEPLLGLDEPGLEAYLGRAVARAQLGRLEEAKADFIIVRARSLSLAATCEDWLTWIDAQLASAAGPPKESGEGADGPFAGGPPRPATGPDRQGSGSFRPPRTDGPPSPIQVYLDRERAWFEDNAGQIPWSQAYLHETPHYRIRTNVRRDQADYYGRLLEAYHAKYEQVFAAGADEAAQTRVRETRSEVRIYARQSEFVLHEDRPGALGLYYSGSRALALFHGNSGEWDNSRVVIAHEAAHQFQHLLLGGRFHQAPIWLLEGFAAFFESAYYDDQKQAIVTGFTTRRYLESLRRCIAAGEVIDLETLLQTPQSEFGYLHYAHAWLYIHMMIYHGSKKTRTRNQKIFSDLFFSAARGPLTHEEVVRFFGGAQGMAEIQAEWRKYAGELKLDFDPRKR